jgi:hypothetical protein
MKRRSVAAAAAVALLMGAVPAADAAQSSGVPTVKRYANCKALNKDYKHGVGRKGAVDKTSGKRVTNFTRNNKVYRLYSRSASTGGIRDLDRDNDGIACEKR